MAVCVAVCALTCLELALKVCFSRGEAVQLLISSNIGRYLDFKVINNTFMFAGDELQEVPCSKQTLLLNKDISPKDKRLLVKFLQFCSSYDEASAEYQGVACAWCLAFPLLCMAPCSHKVHHTRPQG
jgi:RAB protein geranylgeranyltransferase component A